MGGVHHDIPDGGSLESKLEKENAAFLKGIRIFEGLPRVYQGFQTDLHSALQIPMHWLRLEGVKSFTT